MIRVAQCVTAWYRDQAYFDAPWRGRWENEGGGPTLGHGIHQMELMLSVLDALERGERPPVGGAEARATLELITAVYKSAVTGAPVRRGDIGDGDPFHRRLHGGTPDLALEASP